ncbi:hypothetical protein M413DRAFT_412270 [Hebeloma cylindrosporum]|uniref:Uncharacterized protein n=1 Tax=Hebeloma cylindrosporum TaxID=76867 RepID=A0A0C2YJK0_HEBCY|nr:hypothetical protein M413DRAFT_412270 [Hebeloma cylindrosporum h7]
MRAETDHDRDNRIEAKNGKPGKTLKNTGCLLAWLREQQLNVVEPEQTKEAYATRQRCAFPSFLNKEMRASLEFHDKLEFTIELTNDAKTESLTESPRPHVPKARKKKERRSQVETNWRYWCLQRTMKKVPAPSPMLQVWIIVLRLSGVLPGRWNGFISMQGGYNRQGAYRGSGLPPANRVKERTKKVGLSCGTKAIEIRDGCEVLKHQDVKAQEIHRSSFILERKKSFPSYAQIAQGSSGPNIRARKTATSQSLVQVPLQL